jgi:hypothetical protein
MSRSAKSAGLVWYVSGGCGMFSPIDLSMRTQRGMSSQSTNVTATPVAPARPVRPIRWV